jgi:hypothetical protein
MAITPAQAASAPPHGELGYARAVHEAFQSSAYDSEAETASDYRGYRGYRRHRHDGVDAGDVIAGVLVLGGIAAIASAASNNRRERERDVVVVERERNRYDNPAVRRSGGSGLDGAVSQCLGAIERDVRVDSVDGATRLPEGWVVSGTLFNGSGFTCRIDNSGRISDIDYGGFAGSGLGAADGQWSEDRYADARAAMGMQAPDASATLAYNTAGSAPQPAYPGGPLPGEEGYPGN